MSRLADLIFFRNHRLCPRWLCFTFDNPVRRWIQNPDRIIAPYVRQGDLVLDIGPGLGYFTIAMAKQVGEKGRVIAADLQESMLKGIAARARKEGVEDRIILRLSCANSINVGGPFDFILAFWMLHEVPNIDWFIAQLANVSKKGGKILIAEPRLHVSQSHFLSIMDAARQSGLVLLEQPAIPLSLSALFSKK